MPRKPMGDPKVFAKNFDGLVTASGKSNREIAEAVGMFDSQISKLRSQGANAFNGDDEDNNGKRLARLFGVEFQSLWSKSGVKFIENPVHEKMPGHDVIVGPIADMMRELDEPGDRERWKKLLLNKAALVLDGPHALWLEKCIDLAITSKLSR